MAEPVKGMCRGTCFPIVVVLAVLAGCSRTDGRVGVSGTVALDGKSLANGLINFRPAPGNAANSAGGPIKDGAYELPAASGLKPGKYLVTVQTFQKTGRTVADPQTGSVDELAPVRFNEADTLEATVTAGAANKFDFQLTTSAAGR